MRHLTLAAMVLLAIGFPSASASLEAKVPTLVFASVHEVDPGQPQSPDTLADLFLLRGNRVVRRLTHTTRWEEYPAWSPDSRRIAFSRGDPFCHANSCERRANESSIWVRRLNGGTARRLTRAGSDYIDSSPVWSPDGRKIAFARRWCCDDGPMDGIYTVDPNGQNLERINTTRAYVLDWAPDGSTLAFISEAGGIRLLDPSTGDVTRLTITNIGPGKSDIAWSPRGDRLALATIAGVYVVNSTGGRARRVVKARGDYLPDIPNLVTVSWAPDGHRLAFSATLQHGLEARSDIYVIGVNGRGLTQLTTNPGPDFDPHWRP
jgi:TolB protein